MKKQTGIILLGVTLIAVLYPRKDVDTYVVNEGSGPLQLSGYSIRVPFIQPIRIGTWRAHYSAGELGKEIDYSYGNLLSYREFYPSGKLRFTGGYLENKRHGDWSMHSEDGRLISKIIYSKGDVSEHRLFSEEGEIILHEKDGKILVDRMTDYMNKKDQFRNKK